MSAAELIDQIDKLPSEEQKKIFVFLAEKVIANGNEASITSAVPEPSTWLLLASGCLGLLGYGWRRRQRAV